MGRSKLSSGEKDRQPRVDTAASDVQETDPIAAAAHAKKAREETRIKAAAAAAAKAFAGKSKTVFFESTGVSTTTDNTPRPESNSALANSSTRTSSNPLASILGYDNDDSASEDGSEPPSPRAITAAQAATSPDAAESITTNAEPGKDNAEEEDPMLASFMSELESSGLLERDSAQKPAQDTLPHGTDTEQADSRISTSPKPQTAEPAEQRVLGNLEGAPTWREVMDMASGKVYFWEQDTDEVAWEPPPGMSAAEASSSLPNWAGYYMAHGYTYPYYGQAAGASTSQPAAAAAAGSVGPDPAATPTSHAADFLATRLAKDPSPTPQPAIQMPAPVKKKQYRAEPAPAPPVDPDGAAGAADGVLTALPVPTAGPGPDKQAQEAEAKKRKRPKAPVGLGQLAAKKKKGTKGVSGLIDKWQAVRKDLEEQEAKAEEEQFPDPAAQERKRSEEAEKWRLHQLQAGASSEDNANFQPLAVDWREKLKATRKGSKKAPAVSSLEAATPAAPSQATTSPPKPGEAAELGVTADGKPNLGLLSKGLPPGWQAMWDKNTGDIYYGNLKSRETSWDRPR
ncbi:hypothetical protein WJX79_009065 [Trebouxia sp. C0005]